MTVFVQGSTGEPTVLLGALAEAPEASRGVHYVGCFLAGVNGTDPAAFHPEASLTAFFVHGPFEQSYDAGKLRLVPAGYRSIYAYMERLGPVDLALIQTSAPDADGDYTLGLAVDFQPAVLARAKCVVAEVNHAMPALSGSIPLPASRIDYAVESERPVIGLETGELGEVAERIGRNVAGLVEDGAVIQIGIGKLPAAILKALHDRRDLGLQGGMIADGCIELVERGVMTGARKTVEPGRMVCGCALGSQRLYDWLVPPQKRPRSRSYPGRSWMPRRCSKNSARQGQRSSEGSLSVRGLPPGPDGMLPALGLSLGSVGTVS